MKTIDQEVAEAFQVKDLNIYEHRFSPSSLPFCPRKLSIYTHATDDIKAGYYWDYSGEFYTSLGHTIHAITQKQLGKAGLLFGNWKCCGITRNNQHAKRCLVCTKYPDYVEYRIDKVMNGIGGFVDGVLLNHNSVLEIKTKSTKAIQEMKEPIWYEWTLQASVYATALNRMYDWSLNKIVMLYISRENPHLRKIFVVPVIKTSLDNQVAAFNYGKECVKLKVLPSGICQSPSDDNAKYCIYSAICFRPDLAEKLKLTDVQP
jgi:hypothetical protein